MEKFCAPNAFSTPIILVLSNTSIMRQVMRLTTATTIIIPSKILFIRPCRLSQSNIFAFISCIVLLYHLPGNASESKRRFCFTNAKGFDLSSGCRFHSVLQSTERYNSSWLYVCDKLRHDYNLYQFGFICYHFRFCVWFNNSV